MLADLALTSVAVIKPLEETILVNKLDAPTASARVPERILVVTGIPADPTNVLLFIVVVVLAGSFVARLLLRRTRRRRGGGRRRGGVDGGGGDIVPIAGDLRRRHRR